MDTSWGASDPLMVSETCQKRQAWDVIGVTMKPGSVADGLARPQGATGPPINPEFVDECDRRWTFLTFLGGAVPRPSSRDVLQHAAADVIAVGASRRGSDP